MDNNLITFFYIDYDLKKEFPDICLSEFKGLIEPRINNSISRYISLSEIRKKEGQSIPDNIIIELHLQRKMIENKIKESIKIDIVDGLFAIMFNYNVFLSDNSNIQKPQQNNNLDSLENMSDKDLLINEYKHLVSEIMKYFKLEIYEDNMNHLMENQTSILPIENIKLVTIIKNMKSKIIELNT